MWRAIASAIITVMLLGGCRRSTHRDAVDGSSGTTPAASHASTSTASPTDRHRTDADTCESLVIAVVASTAEATRLLAAPTNSPNGHRSQGLRIGSGPPDSALYSVAVHESHDDQLVTLGWWDVDPQSGLVTKDDEPQRADPALVAKMKTECRR